MLFPLLNNIVSSFIIIVLAITKKNIRNNYKLKYSIEERNKKLGHHKLQIFIPGGSSYCAYQISLLCHLIQNSQYKHEFNNLPIIFGGYSSGSITSTIASILTLNPDICLDDLYKKCINPF